MPSSADTKKCDSCGRDKMMKQYYGKDSLTCILCEREAKERSRDIEVYKCLGNKPSGGYCTRLIRSRQGYRLCWSCKGTSEWRDGENYYD
jgi:hypothetical protein